MCYPPILSKPRPKGVRAREQESKRAREQESKRAREQESKRAREQESKRAREQESEMINMDTLDLKIFSQNLPATIHAGKHLAIAPSCTHFPAVIVG